MSNCAFGGRHSGTAVLTADLEPFYGIGRHNFVRPAMRRSREKGCTGDFFWWAACKQAYLTILTVRNDAFA